MKRKWLMIIIVLIAIGLFVMNTKKQAGDTNALDNPSFETTNSAWSVESASGSNTASYSTEWKSSGSQSMKLNLGDSFYFLSIYQNVDMTGVTGISLRYSPASNVNLGFTLVDSGTLCKDGNGNSFNAENGIATRSISGITGIKKLCIDTTDSGVTYIDDIELTAQSCNCVAGDDCCSNGCTVDVSGSQPAGLTDGWYCDGAWRKLRDYYCDGIHSLHQIQYPESQGCSPGICSNGVCIADPYTEFLADKAAYVSAGSETLNMFITNSNQWIGG